MFLVAFACLFVCVSVCLLATLLKHFAMKFYGVDWGSTLNK